MRQYHVITSLSQLLIAIIESIVAEQREGVALIHPHMSESLK